MYVISRYISVLLWLERWGLKNTDSDAFHEVGARPTHKHTCVAEVTVINQKLAFELLFIGLSFSCDIDSIAPTTAARNYFDAIKKPINILRCAVLSPYKTGQVNRFKKFTMFLPSSVKPAEGSGGESRTFSCT